MFKIAKKALILLILPLLVVVIAGGNRLHADDSAAWFAGTPLLERLAEATPADAQQQNAAQCTNMTLPVVHQAAQELLVNNEDHCMVATSAGLVETYGRYFQPLGFDKAYPVNNTQLGGGHPVVVPVPNFPSGLLLRGDSSYPGTNIALFKQLSSHLQFNGNIFAPSYTVTPADLTFKYPSGRVMAFNVPSTLSFSNDGEYMVAEGIFHGFVRINLSSLQMVTFAQNVPRNSAGVPQGAETKISPSGRFVTIAYNAPGNWGTKYFKIIDVSTCGVQNAAYNAATSTCQTHDYFGELQAAIPDLVGISNVQFATDDTLNFVATTKDADGYHFAFYSLTAAGKTKRQVEYLGMGDSFASGEGTFNYIDGTETDLNQCHQSVFSYPYLVSREVSSVASVACSGATIDNIIGDDPNNEDNQLKDVFDRDLQQTQIAEAKRENIPGILQQRAFLKSHNPQLVTISVSGNDVGFSDIIKRCVLPFNNVSSSSQNCFQTYEDRLELVNVINNQFDRLVSTYKQLKSGDPTRRIYVIGYPQLVKADGQCGINVRLSAEDTVFATQLVSYLNSVIRRAAQQTGVLYVDTENAFVGHRLCEDGSKAVNGLTAGNNTLHLLGNESFHPNKLGHQLFAQTILSQTNNLTAPMPSPIALPAPTPQDTEAADLLAAPKTSRIVYEIVNLGKDIMYMPKGVVDLSSTFIASKLLPNSNLSAVLHSTPINVGSLHVDGTGKITGSIIIPEDVSAGIHTLHLYGKDMFGYPMDVQQTVYVLGSADDADGDGALNADDSCLGIPNSGVDVDRDGVDDVCDTEIGAVPDESANKITGSTTKSLPEEQDANHVVNATEFILSSNLQPAGQNTLQKSSLQDTTQPEVQGAETVKDNTAILAQTEPKEPQDNSWWKLVVVVFLAIIAIGAVRNMILRRRQAK